MPARFFNFFIFSSVYIAVCALLMVHQTNQLLHLDYNIREYLAFVFFSTICSYNFHWYLTPSIPTEKLRVQWTQQHKTLHLLFFVAGFIGSCILRLALYHSYLLDGGFSVTHLSLFGSQIAAKAFLFFEKNSHRQNNIPVFCMDVCNNVFAYCIFRRSVAV